MALAVGFQIVDELPLFVLSVVEHGVNSLTFGCAGDAGDTRAAAGDVGDARGGLSRRREKLLNHVGRRTWLPTGSRLRGAHLRIILTGLLNDSRTGCEVTRHLVLLERIIGLARLRAVLIGERVVGLSGIDLLAARNGGIARLSGILRLARILWLSVGIRLTWLLWQLPVQYLLCWERLLPSLRRILGKARLRDLARVSGLPRIYGLPRICRLARIWYLAGILDRLPRLLRLLPGL